MSDAILSVEDLSVVFDVPGGQVKAVQGVSLSIRAGETLALVGESGCGKSALAMSLTGLLARPHGRAVGGRVMWKGRDLLSADARTLRRVRGGEIAMVFQDPMTSLHPSLRVVDQMVEAVRAHQPHVGRGAAMEQAIDLLGKVGVPSPRSRTGDYPHQWSGGMRQRAMIAMAMLNSPSLIIADEPTTALDVTVQAQVLDLMRSIQRETGTALLLISHDLGVVAELADRVAVMYAGRLVEVAPVEALFEAPAHPYTEGLLASVPRLDGPVQVGAAIPGAPPSLVEVPAGCAFRPRCRIGRDRTRCAEDTPQLREVASGRGRAACWFTEELRGD